MVAEAMNTAEGHRTLKHKYIELGRDDTAIQVYLYKRLRAKKPVRGVHVDSDPKTLYLNTPSVT
jgi:hypothetical protein